MKNKFLILSVFAAMCACMPIPSIDDENNPDAGEDAVYPFAVYTFENSASDISGNGYNGVLNGSPEFISDTPDGSASALRLNGFKNQFVTIPYDLFSGLKKYSFSIWIKDFSQGMVFSAQGGYGIPYLCVRDSQKLALHNNHYYNLDDYTFSYDCTSLMSGSWHHLAVTSDEGVISLYVDGTKIDSIDGRYEVSNAAKVYIGGNADDKYDTYMSMKIDNAMFFDYCLTQSEINYIYQNKL